MRPVSARAAATPAHHDARQAEPAGTGGGENPPYRAWFFGPFRVTLPDRQPIPLRPRVKKLLKWFLLHQREQVSGDDLIELLWPSSGQEAAGNNLNVTLHCLRRALEPGLPPRHPSSFVRTDGRRNYWFDTAGQWWTDVREVHDLDAAAREADRRGDEAAAAGLYGRLVRYGEPTFLPEDLYDDAFALDRYHHDAMLSHALDRLMQLNLKAAHLVEALSYAWRALSLDCLDREAHRVVVDVYRRQGNPSAALHELDEFMRMQERELGVTRDPELLALRLELLEQLGLTSGAAM